MPFNARLATATLTTFGLLASAAATTPLAAAEPRTRVEAQAAAPAAKLPSGWKPRPAKYTKTVTINDIPIRVSDGTILRGNLTRPATADGKAVAGKLPTLVTITAYNKSASSGIGLGGADPGYLVKRGYAQLTVDARGTGNSEGVWGAFSKREGLDAAEVVEWAHRQPWSTGKVGMTGPSYLGITQLFAAAHHPKGLKAIFPQVPAADVYRDVVASGGQVDAGFIPLWLGLVTGLGLIPPAYADDPQSAIKSIVDHLMGATTFTVPLLAGAALGGDPSYDGAFYKERSPINVINKVKVPTFLIGGEYDLFQRGTPMLFDRLRRNGVTTRMIIGPWDHLQGSSGAEVAKAGYGTLSELQLRWFDKYLLDKKDRALLTDVKPFTYFEQGTGTWVQKNEWLQSDLSAKTFALSGSSTVGLRAGDLTSKASQATDKSILLPLPVAGLCTRSMNQWTAGIMNMIWPDNPCLQDNALNDYAGLTFQTAPMKKTVRMQGPMNARIYTSSLTGDGMLSVAVEDVAPNGKVSRLTGGWQTISQRALIKSKSKFMDGKLIQAYHPFTRASKRALPTGQVAPIDVEIFPTGAAIKPGHRLRISIQSFDIPHLVPTLPNAIGQGSPLTIYTGKKYPSELTIPVR